MSHSKYHLRHPALLGVVIWGVSHLLSNGDAASMVLFASLTAWAIFKMARLGRNEQERRLRQSKTPALQWDVAALILAFISYSLLLIYHGPLFNYALIDPR